MRKEHRSAVKPIPRRAALIVPNKEEDSENEDDKASTGNDDDKTAKATKGASARLSVVAASRPRARRPTTVFQLRKPQNPTTWANNITDTDLTPEDQFEAAVKLADAAAGGDNDSIDLLVRVVGNSSQNTFSRCSSASALAAAALTTNASLLEWNEHETDHHHHTHEDTHFHKGGDSSKIRGTLFHVHGKTLGAHNSHPSHGHRPRGAMHHQDIVAAVNPTQSNRKTVRGTMACRATMHHDDLVSALKAGTDAQSSSVRQVAGDDGVFDAIKSAMSDPNPEIRLTAVQILGDVATTANFSMRWLLAKAARDQDSRIRVAAVTSISNLAGHLRVHYEAMLSEQAGWQQILAKADRLKERDDELGEDEDEEEEQEMFEQLLDMLVSFTGKEHDADMRLAAASGIAEVAPRGQKRITETLLKLLAEEEEFEHISSESGADSSSGEDSDEFFHAAVKACHQKKNFRGLLFGKTLRRKAKRDSFVPGAAVAMTPVTQASQLRAAAATALGATCKAGDSKVSQALAYAMEDAHGEVRAAALGAIMDIAGQPANGESFKIAVKAALRHSRDEDVTVRLVAAAHLGHLVPWELSDMHSDRTTVGVLLHNLEDADPNVRRLAANSLAIAAKCGDNSVLQALAQRLLHDSDWAARRAAIDALEELMVKEKDFELLETLKG